MVKDKRAMVQIHDENMRKIEKCNRIIAVLHSFSAEVAQRVNRLLTAEEIDIRLYEQDDKDRRQTVLYGINEEMGNNDVKAETPIQVNNNCLQCSGNASFIKKAFKLACLSYASSRVKYQNQEWSREELLSRR